MAREGPGHDTIGPLCVQTQGNDAGVIGSLAGAWWAPEEVEA